MSLLADGKSAVAAMAREDTVFPRIKPADWSAAAVKLAKKQVVSAGLTAEDLDVIKTIIGAPVFDKTLGDLTAFQAKLLAKRIHPDVSQEEIASKSMALGVIRTRLAQVSPPDGQGAKIETAKTDAGDMPEETPEPPPPGPTPPKPNPYIGRKAFRVR